MIDMKNDLACIVCGEETYGKYDGSPVCLVCYAGGNLKIKLIQDQLKTAIEWLENLMPYPSYPGSCGPESSCDIQCMESASLSEFIRSTKKDFLS